MASLERVIEYKANGDKGVVVFRGTQVPVKYLFDYLKAGDSVDGFLDAFAHVPREQAHTLLDISWATMTSQVGPARDIADADPAALTTQMIDFALSEAFIAADHDEFPHEALEAFWESCGLAGENWPPEIMRKKRQVSRLVGPILNERRRDRLLASLNENRETLVARLAALAESAVDQDPSDAVTEVSSRFWNDFGYGGYNLPREVEDLTNEIEREAAEIIQRRRVSKAQTTLSEDLNVLASELLSFYKRRRQQSLHGIPMHLIVDDFWRAKGIADPDSVPPDLMTKMAVVLENVEQLIQKEEEVAERAGEEAERRELEALIDECVEWALHKGLRKVTLQDADLFLARRGRGTSQRGKRFLYLETNDRLRFRA